MPGLLANHVAAITGAGSGIGRAIAEGYAREGAEIVILDADPQGAKETQRLITAAGGKAHVFTLDVRDREAANAIAGEVAAKAGRISVLVNNAGINRRNHFTADAAAVAKDWGDIYVA